MAIIKTPSYVTGISGKVCSHEANEYRTNSCSGKIVLSKKCNPFDGEATENQVAVRSAFKSRMAVLREWINTNHPTSDNKEGTALYQEAMKIKKAEKLDNLQAAVSLYQMKESPYTILLPSEGGTRQNSTKGTTGGSSTGGSTTSTKYTVTLVASPASGGSVSGAGQYTAGTTVTVKASALSGYKFSQWSDGNTSATRSVTVNSNISLTATFVADAGASTIPEGDETDA